MTPKVREYQEDPDVSLGGPMIAREELARVDEVESATTVEELDVRGPGGQISGQRMLEIMRDPDVLAKKFRGTWKFEDPRASSMGGRMVADRLVEYLHGVRPGKPTAVAIRTFISYAQSQLAGFEPNAQTWVRVALHHLETEAASYELFYEEPLAPLPPDPPPLQPGVAPWMQPRPRQY